MRSIILLTVILQFLLLSPAESQQQLCDCPLFTSEKRKAIEALLRENNYGEATAAINVWKADANACCQAIGLTLESLLLLSQSDLEKSFSSAKAAQVKLDNLFHPYASLESARLLGNYYSRIGKHDSSTYFYFEALDLSTNVDESHLKAKIYNGIALDFLRQEQMDKGLEFTKKALAAAIPTQDTLLLAQYFSDLGIIYGSVYDKDENPAYLDSIQQTVQKALVFAKFTKSNLSIMKNYLSLGKVAETKEEFSTALLYTDTVITFINSKTKPHVLASIYMLRGAAFSGLLNHKKAIENQQKAFEFALLSENPYLEKTTQLYLYEAYKAAGETSKALQALERNKFLTDSLVKVENLETISRMEEKYNKKINEQQIKELSQTASIQALEIKQKNFWLVGIVLSALLISAVLFLYFRQRTLSQQQKALAIENRFLRFQLDPHFLSNALVSIQRFMLENKSSEAASYLTKFSRLMRQLLEYSREELITIEEEIDLLRNYLDIQQLRLKDKFTYEIKVDPELLVSESKIQPMFAQPFVENAIEHGVSDKDGGKIEIVFRAQGNDLILEIVDNGPGLKQESDSTHQSLSTKIIRERIALLNQSNSRPIQLRLGNVISGNGTRVQLILPIYS